MARLAIAAPLAVLLAGGWLLGATPGVAQAAPREWKVTRYSVVATPEADGGMTTIVLDLDFDFGTQSAHGPELVLREVARVPDNPNLWRVLQITIISVTSSTGAGTGVETSHKNDNLRVRIGDPDAKVSGVQSYRVQYRVHGLIEPGQQPSGLDQFDWEVIWPGWKVPVSSVTVSVNAPAAATSTGCGRRDLRTSECSSPPPAASMTWSLDHLENEETLAVRASFPAGTFTNAAYTTKHRVTASTMTTVNRATAAVSGAVALVVVATTILVLGRRRSLGGREVPADLDGFVPEQVSPAEFGALVRQSVDIKASLVATIVDLAVRGYVHIQPYPAGQSVLTLRSDDRRGLLPHERRVMDLLLWNSRATTGDLSRLEVWSGLERVEEQLIDGISTEPNRWWYGIPLHVRGAWIGVGGLMSVVGLVLWLALGFFQWGLPGAVLGLLGLVIVALAFVVPTITPLGRAVRREALRFERSLRTEARAGDPMTEGSSRADHRARPTMAELSRHLPFAIAAGFGEGWVRTLVGAAEAMNDNPPQGQGNVLAWYGDGRLTGELAVTIRGLTAALATAETAAQREARRRFVGSGDSGGGGGGGDGGGGW